MIRSAFMAPAGSEFGGGIWATNPPAGDPSSVSAYFYGDEFEGLFVGVQWANGDATAVTQVGFSASEVVEPTSVWTAVSPGVQLAETGRNFLASEFWWARHTKGGTPGDWIGGVQP